jgi:hypothetical protein
MQTVSRKDAKKREDRKEKLRIKGCCCSLRSLRFFASLREMPLLLEQVA